MYIIDITCLCRGFPVLHLYVHSLPQLRQDKQPLIFPVPSESEIKLSVHRSVLFGIQFVLAHYSDKVDLLLFMHSSTN